MIEDERTTKTDAGFASIHAEWREPLRRALASATSDILAVGEAVEEAMAKSLQPVGSRRSGEAVNDSVPLLRQVGYERT